MSVKAEGRYAILVESSSEALDAVGELLEAAFDSFIPVKVLENDVGKFLRQLPDKATPLLTLAGPDLASHGNLVRELQRSGADSEIVFMARGRDVRQLRGKLKLLPMRGLRWTLVEVENPELVEILNRTLEASWRRKQLRNTLNRANQEIQTYLDADRARGARTVSEHYLTNFLSHTHDAIIAIDNELRVLYWSAGAQRLIGLEPKDAVGLPISSLPFWSPELEERMRSIGAETDVVTFETGFESPAGLVSVEAVCSVVRDEVGARVGSSLVIRDVTERKQRLAAEWAEQSEVTRRIDRERQYLRNLFKQAPGFIAVTRGPTHVFDLVNDAYLEIVGRREVLGKAAAQALPEMQGQAFLTLLDQVYSSGLPFVGRGIGLSVARRQGADLDEVFVDFVFQPIFDERGCVTGIFCQGSDITQHKRTQDKLAEHQTQLEALVNERTKQLEASQEALRRSQKLEAIGQLTGGVAHDFNNVLQIIASNLQLLQLSVSDPEQRQRSVNAAIEAVDRGSKLSGQLLAFARRQPLQPLPVNLGRVLRGMDDMLRRALGETIEIETIVAGGLWNTLVDPHQLENVILNLSINARDAMPQGGRLTLELGNAVLDDHYTLTQPDVSPGQYVMLAVSDTGTGMSPEVMERAFDPFFTTKREGEGTGLGLSMTYGFVKQSGGHIRIYSEQGNGTTFKIYLPRSLEAEVELPRSAEVGVTGGSETILVVEDDPAVQEAAAQTLRGLGYRVLRASDAQSALNILQSGVHVDMLFTDVVMPGQIHSPDLARQAKRIFPDIAVLFTSGYTRNAIVHSGRLDPGVELLSKPYRREDLARKVRQVFAGRTPDSSTPAALLDSDSRLAVLVVEDEPQNRDIVCQLLNLLGHKSQGVGSAEEADAALDQDEYDVLLTDIHLPGSSGLELAARVAQGKRRLGLILASGYGGQVAAELEFDAVVLPKPYDLAALREALAIANAKRVGGG